MYANTAAGRRQPSVVHLLLAGGGLFLLWRVARAMGTLFWTLSGLALAVFWSGGWRLLAG